METLQKLQMKQDLEASDAPVLLQFLQEHTAPILSLRNTQSSGVVATNKPNTTHCTDSLEAPVKYHIAGPRSSKVASKASGSQTVDSARARTDHSSTSEYSVLARFSDAQREKSDVSLDLSSLEQFPPMEHASTRKSGRKSESPRRITLTPMESQPAIPQFSSTGNTWKSNPAFTRNFSSFESPLPLNEERKLLQQERKHRGSRSGQKGKSHQDSSQSQGHFSTSRSTSLTSTPGDRVDHTSPAIARKAGSASREGGVSYHSSPYKTHSTRRSQDQTRREDATEETLDSRISGHSIFELTRSHRGERRQGHSSRDAAHRSSRDATDPDKSSTTSVGGQSSQESPSLATSSTCTASIVPLTSTPFNRLLVPARGCMQASPSRVSQMESLETLAELYAKAIKARLVPNITSEIHFVLQLLTATVPPTVAHKLMDGGLGLFESIDNCVYFAVAVISRIRHLLTALDKPTLRLLSENIRIAEFQPELAVFFTGAYDNALGKSSSHHSWSQDSRHIGVPFQEDTDNSSNFPNLKAFHAFKKQRDNFYSVLREWEKYHERLNWNMQAALGERIRLLIRQPAELCSHAHLARLFQKQLAESCRSAAETGVGADISDSLVGHLRKMDPHRFMRLNERFLHPSTGGGPCPPPVFSQAEEFFSGFILAADSYEFNCHLKATFYAELVKLHSSCSSLQPKDLPDAVYTMRVLAKFLGFLEFLPYRNPSPNSLLPARSMVPPFKIEQFVQEACELGHLCVTVPWVVEYLSMMDSQATLVDHYCTLLHTLMDIYRSVPLRMRPGRDLPMDYGQFLIVTALGWLFEIPNMSTSAFFEYVKCTDSTTPSLVLPDVSECLDSQGIITAEVLYACCPFLGEIRSMLAEFAAGLQSRASPIRKIKPISTEIDPVENTAARQLQTQLQENFFRSHPPYVKQLCDIIAERIGASAIAHCESRAIPQHTSDGIRTLTEWMREKCSDGGMDTASGTELFNKAEADTKLMEITEEVTHVANEVMKVYFQSHCQTQAQKSMELLLGGTMNDQVIGVVSGITTTWAFEKCTKWTTDKLRAVVYEELSKGFEKIKRAVISHLRNEAAQPTDQQSVSLLNQTPGVQSLSQESISEVLKGAEGVFETSTGMGFDQMAPQWKETHPKSSLAVAVLQSSQDTSPLEEFRAVAETMLGGVTECPTADQLKRLQSALVRLTDHLESKATILPGLPIPQLMPVGMEDLLRLSVDLASNMISRGLLTLPQEGNQPKASVVMDILERFQAFWKLMKGLKLEVPIKVLLSATAFKGYIQQQENGQKVWQSLGDVLVSCVHCDIVSSTVVEALWLCRKQQLPPDEVQHLLTAATVFLNTWLTVNKDSQCVFCESFIDFREVHFVRLLSTVLQELDHSDIPDSVLSHVHLKDIIHPL